jgi:branched-chain amino acid transport system ATP-binding protein
MSSAETPALVADGVTVRFGGLTALDEVSLTVPSGGVVGVIGPNGAGKTTLFNVICGFVRPTAGTLRLHGRPLRRHRPHQLARLGISRTLQGLGLFPNLSVLDNVTAGAGRHARAGFGSALFGLPRSDRDERQLRDRARQVLTDLGADDYRDRMPGELPYGIAKRVALARALVAEPDLLLLDEPAGGLAAREIDELGELVTTRLRGQLSVLLVEHHMDFVTTVCDSVVVLDFGRVICTGTPEEVRADPRVTEAYLGENVEHAEDTEDTGDATDGAGGTADAAGTQGVGRA